MKKTWNNIADDLQPENPSCPCWIVFVDYCKCVWLSEQESGGDEVVSNGPRFAV